MQGHLVLAWKNVGIGEVWRYYLRFKAKQQKDKGSLDRLIQTKSLKINVSIDPIKILGTYISHDSEKNNKLNFFLKIQKMETEWNIWLSRSLTLVGKTLLAKTLGIS